MTMALGIIGLGTMGGNIARNAARNGAVVYLYNRHAEKTRQFMNQVGSEGKFAPTDTLQHLCTTLPKPRVLLLMVKAGEAVDAVFDEMLPLLEKGDIVIDGGNSHYRDTVRRADKAQQFGIHFIGMGISGGEEGALRGPSLMPGGNQKAVEKILPFLNAIAADDGLGGKCVTYVGPGGSGHFVKMVHNGIEYGVMQLIAETYALLKSSGHSSETIARTFQEWTSGDLQSYLMEITVRVLSETDAETGKYVVELIQDKAGQKGTGRWTVEAALQYGVAIPTISAAVDARQISSDREERLRRKAFLSPNVIQEPWASCTKEEMRSALAIATFLTYAQGFSLLYAAAKSEGWDLPMAEIARIWRGGCIIRSPILARLQNALGSNVKAAKHEKESAVALLNGADQRSLRKVAAVAIATGVPTPAYSATIHFLDASRSDALPQNLIQAQRDYFGAHTYERIDRSGIFHTQW